MTERARPSVLAIVPVRASDLRKTSGMPSVGERPLIAYTLEAARQARSITRVVVSTDSEEVRALATTLGAEAPFLRPATLADAGTPIERVLQHCVLWLEKEEGYRPDVVVRLEISHPLRDEGIIDRVVGTLLDRDLDSVFTVYEERHRFWRLTAAGDLEPLFDEGQVRPSRQPIYKEVGGVASASRADVVRSGERLGKRVGVAALTSLSALLDTQDPNGLELAQRLL